MQASGKANKPLRPKAHLSCNPDQKISAVKFASFGTPQGGCGSFQQGSCHAHDSYDIFNKDIIHAMPHDAHPMGVLVTAMSALSVFHPDANPALKMQAATPVDLQPHHPQAHRQPHRTPTTAPSAGPSSSFQEVAQTKEADNKKIRGYVKEVVTYMVMDDLSVKPMSTISSITLINTFGVKDLSQLEEKTVSFGKEEGLKLLMASLKTDDKVLTTVFMQ